MIDHGRLLVGRAGGVGLLVGHGVRIPEPAVSNLEYPDVRSRRMPHVASVEKKIQKDGKTVSYVVRYRDPSGDSRSKSFTRRKYADAFKTDIESKLQVGDWIAPERQKVTLRELVEQDAARASAKNTRVIKLATASNLGRLGKMPIGKIESTHIEQWLDELRDGRPWADDKPLATSSIGIYLRNVKTALNSAVKARPPLLAKSPAEHIRPPKVSGHAEVTADEIPTVETIEAIITAAAHTINRKGDVVPSTSPLSTMILTQASTGLRPGELCGLRRSNIDLGAAELHVRHQAGRKGNPWTWEPLKTPASRRTVPIPERALTALRAHLKANPDLPDDAPLFITRRGSQFTSTTYGELFTNARDTAVPDAEWTPHDCRHFYASLLIGNGVDLVTVQKNLGHGSANETMRTYLHLWPDTSDQTRRAVNAVL